MYKEHQYYTFSPIKFEIILNFNSQNGLTCSFKALQIILFIFVGIPLEISHQSNRIVHNLSGRALRYKSSSLRYTTQLWAFHCDP